LRRLDNPVDPNFVLPIFDRQASREIGLRTFGGIIYGLFWVSLQTRGGNKVDDIASVALPKELLYSFLAAKERAFHINSITRIEILLGTRPLEVFPECPKRQRKRLLWRRQWKLLAQTLSWLLLRWLLFL
jgi:hypothetical protein